MSLIWVVGLKILGRVSFARSNCSFKKTFYILHVIKVNDLVQIKQIFYINAILRDCII